MVRHKTIAIAKELGDTVKTCLLYLAMSESNKTYIIEMNPFTKEKIYHTYRMTQPNRLVKVEFNPFTRKETNKGANPTLTDFKKFKHHFRQSKATKNKIRLYQSIDQSSVQTLPLAYWQKSANR